MTQESEHVLETAEDLVRHVITNVFQQETTEEEVKEVAAKIRKALPPVHRDHQST